MGAKGGGGGPSAAQSQVIRQLRVQSSVYGAVIPIVYGTARVAGNVVWAGEFVATPFAAPSPAKGGGRVAQVQYTYEASVILALAEGPCFQLGAATPGLAAKKTLDAEGRPIRSGSYRPGVWVTKKTKHARLSDPRPRAAFWPFNGYAAGVPNWPTGATFTDQDAGVGPANPKNKAEFAIVQGAVPPPDLKEGTSGPTWTYLHAHPKFGVGAEDEQHLVYPGVAYLAGKLIPLDSNASLPNFNVPLIGRCAYFLVRGLDVPNEIPDAETKVIAPTAAFLDAAAHDIVADLMTNPIYGVSAFGGFLEPTTFDATKRNSFAAYVLANDILISPIYDAQRTAASALEEIAEIANTALVWSEGVLKFVPHGDEVVTSSLTGVLFDPGTVNVVPASPSSAGAFLKIRAALTEDDFLPRGEDGPVTVKGSAVVDVHNQLSIEFTNRANAYSPEVAEAKDAADIASGAGAIRAADAKKMPAIMRESLARDTAQRLLQAQLNRRNSYHFKLGWQHVLLEPMDVVTLLEPSLGLSDLPVRLTEIVESDDGELECVAIDLPIGVRTAASYATQATSGFTHDYNVPAPVTRHPAIYEAPFTAEDGDLVLYLGAVGGSDWGGAAIFLSEDGATYRAAGSLGEVAALGALQHGVDGIAGGWNASGAAAQVLLWENPFLPSLTRADADALRETLIVGGPDDFEMIAYTTATFRRVYRGQLGLVTAYDLSGYARRGLHGTTRRAHAYLEPIALVSSLTAVPISRRLIGQKIYIKLLSRNVYGSGQPNLEDVDPIEWTVRGTALLVAPPDVARLRTAFHSAHVLIEWDPVTDPRQISYEIRTGAAWGTAAVVGVTQEPRLRLPGAGIYWVAARALVPGGAGDRVRYSNVPARVEIAGGMFVENVLQQSDQRAANWPGTISRYADLILDDPMLPYETHPTTFVRTPYPDRSPGAGPLFYWRGGAPDIDYSGHGITPQLGSGVTRVAGLIAQDRDGAFRFNGTSNGYVLAVGHERLLRRLTPGGRPRALGFGLTFVVQRERINTKETLFDSSSGAADEASLVVFISAANVLELAYAVNGIGTLLYGAPGTILLAPTIVTILYDGGTTTRSLRVLINGAEAAHTGNAAIPPLTAWRQVLLGKLYDNSLPFLGVLDEIALYDAPCDPAYSAARGGFTASPAPSERVTYDALRNAMVLSSQTNRVGNYAEVGAEASFGFGAGLDIDDSTGDAFGYYYLPATYPSAVALRRDGGVHVATSMDVASFGIADRFGSIAKVADVPHINAAQGADVSARVEMSVAAGLGPERQLDGGRFGPWRPFVAGRYDGQRFKFRVRLGSKSPQASLRLLGCGTLADVDDIVQQDVSYTGVTGVRVVGRASGAGAADLLIPLEGPIAGAGAGDHYLIVVVADLADPTAAPGVVTDATALNTYERVVQTVVEAGTGQPGVTIFAAQVQTNMRTGELITVGGLPHSSGRVALVLDVFGLSDLGSVFYDWRRYGDGSVSDPAVPADTTMQSLPFSLPAGTKRFCLYAFAWRGRERAVGGSDEVRRTDYSGALLDAHASVGASMALDDVGLALTWNVTESSLASLAIAGPAPLVYTAVTGVWNLYTQTPAGLITHRFRRGFATAPVVQAAITLSPTPTTDALELGTVTRDYFTYRVTNGGNGVAGRQVSWQAQGY